MMSFTLISLTFLVITSQALYQWEIANELSKGKSTEETDDLTPGAGTLCANLRENLVVFESCRSENCFTFWHEDPNNGSIVVIQQGCWVSSGNSHDCERSQCIADRKPSKAMINTKYCCCTGDLCNLNFTDAYVAEDTKETPEPIATKKSLEFTPINIAVIGLISILILLLIVVIVRLIWCYWQTIPKKEDVEMGDSVPPSPDLLLTKLKLLSVIGQGRYGSVWKGHIDEQEVAVKIFPAHHRNYFLNERDLYKEAMEHQALLRCYGGGERTVVNGGPTDYLLILSLEQECLQEYLKKNTIDLAQLSKMSLGVASGLAHLHSDLGKVCVAHRDINSRNILVRSDLTCCICDLGLAVVPRRAENRALSEAGTLRYMAPEVLEGAVNLRDCESALKQIDVYSLGLVLWELGTRCVDMQINEPGIYSPPYYKEIGDHPSLEQMQFLVIRTKARPVWPQGWKDTIAARLLSETAEDCWDQDAEARLTALCVEERLLELPTLRGRVLHPMHPPSSPTLINNNHLHEHNIGHTIDASVGTVETLLSLTEENCKNSNQLAASVTPIQPYHPQQGRNTCMERNLLSTSTSSLLIDKSFKDCTDCTNCTDSTYCTSCNDCNGFESLITNDYLNYRVNHRATPISYVQNAVHDVDPRPSTPKRFKWSTFKKLFKHSKDNAPKQQKHTQVKLINSLVTTSVLNEKRPSTLPLLSPSEENTTKSGISQLLQRRDSLTQQRSLERFTEIFSSTTDLSRLKDPSQRVKTPGDVPPSVRRTRGRAAKESSARFSLYDDRMMCQWGSAPDLEPGLSQPPKLPPVIDLQDRDSVSSF